MGQLYGRLHQSKTEEQEEDKEDKDGIRSIFVMKRNNTFMCLSTDQLTGTITLPRCSATINVGKRPDARKGHFLYEYMDCLKGLDNTFLPPKEAFSRLNNKDMSDEDYASGQEAWRENGMTTLRDFLVWNNNRGGVPFLLAIHREFAFYEQRGVDMFKQGISAPGLTLLYLFNGLPENALISS